MVFCNLNLQKVLGLNYLVTILILVDGFLQLIGSEVIDECFNCHNPYFSRWFSAIDSILSDSNITTLGHNPYFSRWFSAI